MKILYENASSVRRWLESIPSPMVEELRRRRREAFKHVTTDKDPYQVFRAQGELEVYDFLLGLQEELKTFQLEKATGKIK